MNFRIVEGGSDTNSALYDEFKQLYLKDVLTRHIIQKLKINSSIYCKLAKRVREETGFSKPKYKKNPNYYCYSKNDGRYVISKRINGKSLHFTYVDSEDEAKYVVNRLKENNWDKTLVDEFKKEYAKL